MNYFSSTHLISSMNYFFSFLDRGDTKDIKTLLRKTLGL